MARLNFVIDRRLVLKGSAASLLAASLPDAIHARSAPDAVLFLLSDLHAPYARLPSLLAKIRAMRVQMPVPTALLVNGDIFERGNSVCLRSDGAADWAFLTASAREMPLVVNVGNHEAAIHDDLTHFLDGASRAGLAVTSNLVDKRTGRTFTPNHHRLKLGEIDISLLGLAATNPFVYRQPVRETLEFREPKQFLADTFADNTAGADLSLIMSHAGLAADKRFIGDLPAGTILQGAHDHLDVDLVHNEVRYFHGASWGTRIGRLELFATKDGIKTTYQSIPVDPMTGDTELAAIIEAQKAAHLTDDELEHIADIPHSLGLHSSILIATDAMRTATQADVAVVNHTTFGAPLSAGPMNRYDFNAFVRFGGGLEVVKITGKRLLSILTGANQFAARTLDARSGDYVHVAKLDLQENKTYRLAVNSWTAQNQKTYLGTSDIMFEDVAGLELKSVIADHLKSQF